MATGTGTLDADTLAFVRAATGARAVHAGEVVQTLWSGYGEIRRLRLDGASVASAVLKHIAPPTQGADHPRGWNTAASHHRKLASYEIETRWYLDYAARCDERCRVPLPYGSIERDNERYLLLEDLDATWPRRRRELTPDECGLCLHWLANFHARFLGDAGTGLWPVGCYWHLGTRRDEYRAMADSALKRAAGQLDEALSECRVQTLVHGDAKVANFCFADDMSSAAAVDFQYVGRGPGIRDVACLLGSCLSDDDRRLHEPRLLDLYFAELTRAITAPDRHRDDRRAQAVEHEWRALYPLACADYQRFLLGWMPTHARNTRHARQQTERALASLGLTGAS